MINQYHSLCTDKPCTCCSNHPSHRCSRSLHRQQRSACKIRGGGEKRWKHVVLSTNENKSKKQIYVVGQERERLDQKDVALDRCWSRRGKIETCGSCKGSWPSSPNHPPDSRYHGLAILVIIIIIMITTSVHRSTLLISPAPPVS